MKINKIPHQNMGKAEFKEMQETQNKHFWFCGRLKILESIIKSLQLSDDAKILEIGCGTGANLAMLSQFGILSAIEFDDEAREYAEALSGINIYKGFLPDGLEAINGKKFDAICLLDVLEHIQDDKISVAVLHKFLKDNGYLIISVPAYQWMFSQHDVRLGHYRRYTISTLRRVLETSNYEVKFISYVNMILFPAMLMARAVDMFVKKDSGTQLSCNFINKIFTKLFMLESHWLPKYKLPFGGSVIAVAKLNKESKI